MVDQVVDGSIVTGNTVAGSVSNARGVATCSTCEPTEPVSDNDNGAECSGSPVCAPRVESQADAPAEVTTVAPDAFLPSNTPSLPSDQLSPLPDSGSAIEPGNAAAAAALLTWSESSNPVAVGCAVRFVPR